MREDIYCLNCRWLLSLPVGEGAKRELCMFPEEYPQYTVIEGAGYQIYADPASKNAHHDCKDMVSRFTNEPPRRETFSTIPHDRSLLLHRPEGLQVLNRLLLAVLALLALLSIGCAAQDIQNALPFVPKSTTTQTKTVPEVPAIAYDRSIAAIRTIGGVITQLEADTYRIRAQLSGGGVTFTVVVTPDGTGSVLTASQLVSLSHSAYLPVRVCDQFFAAYAR